jgi:hypothetical protein
MLRFAKCLYGSNNGLSFSQESTLIVFGSYNTRAEKQDGSKNEETHGDQAGLKEFPKFFPNRHDQQSLLGKFRETVVIVCAV